MTSSSFPSQAHVSNKRIQRFLNNEEIDEEAVDKVSMGTGKYKRFEMSNRQQYIFRWLCGENRKWLVPLVESCP
jgi:hypothetical protein